MLLLLIIFSGCQTRIQYAYNTDLPLEDYKEYIRRIPLDLSAPPTPPRQVVNYFQYYKIHHPEIPHWLGTIDSGEYKIAANVYLPPEATKTVFLIHGYLLHSASYHYIVDFLLNEGYALVAFDLPGHGFSTGNEADIRDFAHYARVLKDVMAYTRQDLPELETVIGISTGCAVILEYLFNNVSEFKYHVLASPLVRSDLWILSQLGMHLIGGIVTELPGLLPDITSDKEEFLFNKTDLLRRKRVPVTWIKALFKWNEKIDVPETKISEKVLVIQGEWDIVVDWRYNLPFLKRKIKNLDLYVLKRAKHDLFFEIRPIREKVFEKIRSFIFSTQKADVIKLNNK